AAQLSFWALGGISLLTVAGLDLFRRRDADSLLLFCWVVGTMLFAGFVNWVTHARSVLPLALPAAILLRPRLESIGAALGRVTFRTAVPLVAAGALSLALMWTDSAFAYAGRTGAEQVFTRHNEPGHPMWFQGHWGFQYYMEQLGARAVDLDRSPIARGDV